MLPLFGAISDKSKNPRGRRTPFILWGTIVAVAAVLSSAAMKNIMSPALAPTRSRRALSSSVLKNLPTWVSTSSPSLTRIQTSPLAP